MIRTRGSHPRRVTCSWTERFGAVMSPKRRPPDGAAQSESRGWCFELTWCLRSWQEIPDELSEDVLREQTKAVQRLFLRIDSDAPPTSADIGDGVKLAAWCSRGVRELGCVAAWMLW
jgi:hypothetical protein